MRGTDTSSSFLVAVEVTPGRKDANPWAPATCGPDSTARSALTSRTVTQRESSVWIHLPTLCLLTHQYPGDVQR